jgi:hypothetical protein
MNKRVSFFEIKLRWYRAKIPEYGENRVLAK